MKTMELVVECQTGFLGESIPRRFFIGAKPFEVVELLDQWDGKDCWYCKVAADDGCLYILKRDKDLGFWDLAVFKEEDAGKKYDAYLLPGKKSKQAKQ
ncbi:MAG: hypothetical protein H6617_01250 [Bdellovibrionaceae bacterium]|nr:hypothetical protein [Bdellovibrionales bacterium]MCB9253292.1 hypothetical protein [Pseudobdellovibrionaceae bacterium]